MNQEYQFIPGTWYGCCPKTPSPRFPSIACCWSEGVCGNWLSIVAIEFVVSSVLPSKFSAKNLFVDGELALPSSFQYKFGRALFVGSRLWATRWSCGVALFEPDDPKWEFIASLIIPSYKFWSFSRNLCCCPTGIDIVEGIEPITSFISSRSWSTGLCTMFFLYIRHKTQSSSCNNKKKTQRS